MKHEKKSGQYFKIFVGGDTHTGHISGLTPPEYQAGGRKYVQRQDRDWQWFTNEIISDYSGTKKRFDAAIWMGDLVDGSGFKDSSETILSLDRQIDAAIEIINFVDAEKNFIIYGTRIHTRTKDGAELEYRIAKEIGCQISGQLWLNVCDYIIDARHACGSKSSIMTSRGTPLAKERDANLHFWLKGMQPLSHIYLRGHTHYSHTDGAPCVWQGYLVPALQGTSKYGREISIPIDYGFGILEIQKGKWPTWTVKLRPNQMEQVLKL